MGKHYFSHVASVSSPDLNKSMKKFIATLNGASDEKNKMLKANGLFVSFKRVLTPWKPLKKELASFMMQNSLWLTTSQMQRRPKKRSTTGWKRKQMIRSKILFLPEC